MTARPLLIVGVVFLAGTLVLGSGFVGSTPGHGSAAAAEPLAAAELMAAIGPMAPTESAIPTGYSSYDADARPVPAIEANAWAGWPTRENLDRGTRASGPGALPAPFAQADDEGTRVINISAPGDDVDYTLTAPGLSPTNNLETAANQDDPDTVQEVIRGDAATGVIGNGKYDTYRFTGSVDEVRLESDDIDEFEVTIDGESVDPRTLIGEETETTTEVESTATETTTAATTRSTDADTTGADTSTTTSGPAATTDTAGGQSSQSGFGMVMFVLIGIVSGLVLAATLVYVVGSDRFR